MEKMKSLFRNACIGTFVGTASATSFAAGLDIEAVGTQITDAGDKGQEVGGYVILAAVALVVISIILAVVKKV